MSSRLLVAVSTIGASTDANGRYSFRSHEALTSAPIPMAFTPQYKSVPKRVFVLPIVLAFPSAKSPFIS